MLLKVGDLAKRSGLTVRTLHHYDDIGLLTASARSDAGYRLYNRDDVARLHQIQALRRFGLSLTDIGAVLAQPDLHLTSIIAQQIDMLSQQIEQSTNLRDRLARLQTQLVHGEEPDLADWLTTLESMTMYDKYFSPDELKQLPAYQNQDALNTEWPALVAQVRALMQAGVPPQNEEAQTLSKRWMTLVDRDTNGDPHLLAKLTLMLNKERAVQEQTGIDPQLMSYVMQAHAQTKLAIYAKYLNADELAYLSANYSKHSAEWPELVTAVREHMMQGTDPQDADVQKLAKRWLELFRSFASDNPETQAKIGLAQTKEPELLSGTLMNEELFAYVRQAMAHLPAH